MSQIQQQPENEELEDSGITHPEFERANYFGLFERFLGMVVLLIIWITVASTSFAVATQHSSPPSGIAKTWEYANVAMIGTILILFTGRPLFISWSITYRKVKDVIA